MVGCVSIPGKMNPLCRLRNCEYYFILKFLSFRSENELCSVCVKHNSVDDCMHGIFVCAVPALSRDKVCFDSVLLLTFLQNGYCSYMMLEKIILFNGHLAE